MPGFIPNIPGLGLGSISGGLSSLLSGLTPESAQGIAGFLGTAANAIGPNTLGGRLGAAGADMARNSLALSAQNQQYAQQQARDDKLYSLLERLYGLTPGAGAAAGAGAGPGAGTAAYSPAAASSGTLSPLSSLLGDAMGSANPAGQTGYRDRLKFGPLKSLKIDPMGGVSYGFESPDYQP